MSPEQLHQSFHLRKKAAFSLFHGLRDPALKERLLQVVKRYRFITILDKAYPDTLRRIPDAPLVLFYIGDLALLQEKKSLSVIGSRKPSQEAFPKLEYVLTPLLKEDWVIVSGMARGIDGYAHQLTLAHQGKTIAVLGSGFEYIYPKEHIPLFNEISAAGLIVSEYPPFTRPAKHHFPERNRIISGLSFGTLVIEAMERSGTMITVDQALEQGKEIFAVPGSPLIPQTRGCHLLIQDGAKLTQHANDIREEWLVQENLNIPDKAR